MTPQQRDAAISYVTNCLELNPDCPARTRAREYLDDEAIQATIAEVDIIAFEAVMALASHR